jgi:23S rRNA (adenine2503-C2)-methyltransferase
MTTDRVSTTTRYGASRAELVALLETAGAPSYRAAQLYDGLWTQRAPLEELTTLPKALRAELADALPLALELVTAQTSSDGLTSKWLWRTSDGAQVETVLMCSPERATVCVSSQAGCAMGCTFCATGQAGFERQLDAGEIVEQVVRAQHATTMRVSHVVFMGMGEPLANVDAVCSALDRMHGDLGLSARHLTVSTVGVVPGMHRLADYPLPVTLAVSLHAPDDALRDTLVPLNRRYPISAVVDAARDYAAIKGRRVTFEYACIEGVNDDPDQAVVLAGRLKGLRGGAHVNLIPLNPTGAFAGQPPDRERINRFAARLAAAGVTVTVRRNRGTDIDAACGQLRAREAKTRGQARPGTGVGARSDTMGL